ncbi:MAG: T9SS type A sorting domain-containing protein, partial [Candidatus Eiseniibacteriota bacterium]
RLTMRARALAVAVTLTMPLTLAPIQALAANLFGLLDTGELYRSTNNGATWSAIGAIPVHDAVGLAAGTSASELYLASRSGTIYRTTNGGTDWTAVGAVTASDVAGFLLGPYGDVLALTRTGTLYSSSDQGANFSAITSLTGSDWVSLARGPLGRLYALNETGQVAESQDQGKTWTTAGAITMYGAVAIRRLGAELYVLAKTGEVYRSLNYGGSWLPVGALSQGSMSALVELGGQLFAATKEGETATSSNGASWSWVGTINQLNVMALGTDTPQVTGVQSDPVPPRFQVSRPYPNPRVGAGGATFPFVLSKADNVRLELYDVQGRLRAVRPFESMSAGAAAIRWDPPGLNPGAYFVRFVSESGATGQVTWRLVR